MVKASQITMIVMVMLLVAVFSAIFYIGSQTPSAGPNLIAEDVVVRLGSKSAAIYLNLRNDGHQLECVIGVEVYGEGKEGRASLSAELHNTVMEGGVMRMFKVDRVCVPHQSVLKMRGSEGGGYHIMVFGDVEKFVVFHVYLKTESGYTVHFVASAPGGSQMGA
jgi:copper(I)-binding protein